MKSQSAVPSPDDDTSSGDCPFLLFPCQATLTGDQPVLTEKEK